MAGRKIAEAIVSCFTKKAWRHSRSICPGRGKTRASAKNRAENALFPRPSIIWRHGRMSMASGLPLWAAVSAATGRQRSPTRKLNDCAARSIGRGSASDFSRRVVAASADRYGFAISHGSRELVGRAFLHFRREDTRGSFKNRSEPILSNAGINRPALRAAALYQWQGGRSTSDQ